MPCATEAAMVWRFFAACVQLPWPPTRMRPAQSADRLGLGLAYPPWHHLRRVRTLLQSLRAELKIAPPPLVRRFAADAEVLAQLAHAFLFGRQRRHQPHLLVHRTDLPPRHRLTPPAVAFNLLPILPVYSVTYPAGLYRPVGLSQDTGEAGKTG